MDNEDLEKKASEFAHECFGEVTGARFDTGKRLLPLEFANDFYVMGVKCYMAGYKAALEEK